MSIVNLGDQSITFDYLHPATGAAFNTLLRNGIKPGIYKGGELTPAGGSNVSIAPFVAYLLCGDDKMVRIETSTAINYAVNNTTPIISMSFTWDNVALNYLDLHQRATGSGAVFNEVCFGECVFTGAVITSVTYLNKNWGLYHYDEILRAENVQFNSNSLVVDATNHRVGIGATPSTLCEIQGGLTTTGAVLTLGTKEPSVVANDVLGRINFYAPLESDGSDANLVGASIVAIAEGTFSTTVNTTSLFFQTGASETATTKMTLTSGGYLGIGDTTPSYQLELSTDSAGKPGAGGLWTVVSDERIKENIELANNDRCYEIVKNLPLKRYQFKTDCYSDEQITDRGVLGWIAQDVKEVFPKAVGMKEFTIKDEIQDEEGNIIQERESIPDCLDLNAGQIYAAMYGALQKAIEKIEMLEVKNIELENRILQLENK